MKLIFVLAVTALLAVSTVQALSIQQEQEILKQVALLQEVLEEERNDEIIAEDNFVTATATNGSEASILQELHLSNRVRRGVGCISAGPYGGGGGTAFQELQDNCNAIVTEVVVRSGTLIDNIQFTYKTSSGRSVIGNQIGGSGGETNRVRLNDGEKIIAIFGNSASLLDRIGFATNEGRIIGPFGGNGGEQFKVEGCVLRGVFGRAGSLIDSIGFYCGRLN